VRREPVSSGTGWEGEYGYSLAVWVGERVLLAAMRVEVEAIVDGS
jgi:hypothetical protein